MIHQVEMIVYLNTDASEEIGACEVGDVMSDLKVALGSCSTRVHDALGNALSVEVGDLLHQVVVLQQHRSWPNVPCITSRQSPRFAKLARVNAALSICSKSGKIQTCIAYQSAVSSYSLQFSQRNHPLRLWHGSS